MSQEWAGAQAANTEPEVQKEITQLGLDYRLMTQFTSFVAVEDRVVTKDGKPQRVEVPVEMPEGGSYEGVVGGEAKQVNRLTQFSQLNVARGMVGVTKARRGRGTCH